MSLPALLKTTSVGAWLVACLVTLVVFYQAGRGELKAEVMGDRDAEIGPQIASDAANPFETKGDNSESPRSVKLPRRLSHIRFAGGDGRGCENAVKIENAKNTAEGMEAEKLWIQAHYPGSRRIEHAVGAHNGKKVEAYQLKTKDGETINICFDITAFFGRW